MAIRLETATAAHAYKRIEEFCRTDYSREMLPEQVTDFPPQD